MKKQSGGGGGITNYRGKEHVVVVVYLPVKVTEEWCAFMSSASSSSLVCLFRKTV